MQQNCHVPHVVRSDISSAHRANRDLVAARSRSFCIISSTRNTNEAITQDTFDKLCPVVRGQESVSVIGAELWDRSPPGCRCARWRLRAADSVLPTPRSPLSSPVRTLVMHLKSQRPPCRQEKAIAIPSPQPSDTPRDHLVSARREGEEQLHGMSQLRLSVRTRGFLVARYEYCITFGRNPSCDYVDQHEKNTIHAATEDKVDKHFLRSYLRNIILARISPGRDAISTQHVD